MSSLRTAVHRSLLLCSLILLIIIVGSQRQQQTAKAGGESFAYLPIITRPDPFTRGPNLLRNNSFEGEGDCNADPPNLCWYHPNGIPELQIPYRWAFTYKTGPTGFGNESWDVWTRPEVNVKHKDYLPAHEHPLFIWDGDYTLKIFKDHRPISYTLSQHVWLEAGTYIFEMSVFPDLVVGYNDDGSKIWAPDPLSGEVRLLAGNASTARLLPTFGKKNTYYLVFHVPHGQNVQMGVDIRGRWAIRNNGWFMDDWHLWRATAPTLSPGVYTFVASGPVWAADYVAPVEPYVFPIGQSE